MVDSLAVLRAKQRIMKKKKSILVGWCCGGMEALQMRVCAYPYTLRFAHIPRGQQQIFHFYELNWVEWSIIHAHGVYGLVMWKTCIFIWSFRETQHSAAFAWLNFLSARSSLISLFVANPVELSEANCEWCRAVASHPVCVAVMLWIEYKWFIESYLMIHFL